MVHEQTAATQAAAYVTRSCRTRAEGWEPEPGEAVELLDVGLRACRGRHLGEELLGGAGKRAGAVEAIPGREHRTEEKRFEELGAGLQVGCDARRLGEDQCERVVGVQRRRRLGDAGAHLLIARWIDDTCPEVCNPASLELEQRKVRARGRVLADEAESREIGMQRT